MTASLFVQVITAHCCLAAAAAAAELVVFVLSTACAVMCSHVRKSADISWLGLSPSMACLCMVFTSASCAGLPNAWLTNTAAAAAAGKLLGQGSFGRVYRAYW
jgi:hypothetical protein